MQEAQRTSSSIAASSSPSTTMLKSVAVVCVLALFVVSETEAWRWRKVMGYVGTGLKLYNAYKGRDIREADLNGDGNMDMKELSTLLGERATAEDVAELASLIDEDVPGDGVLSRRELDDFMQCRLRELNTGLRHRCNKVSCNFVDHSQQFPTTRCNVFLASDGVHLSKVGVRMLAKSLSSQLQDHSMQMLSPGGRQHSPVDHERGSLTHDPHRPHVRRGPPGRDAQLSPFDVERGSIAHDSHRPHVRRGPPERAPQQHYSHPTVYPPEPRSRAPYPYPEDYTLHAIQQRGPPTRDSVRGIGFR